ncbi:MAG: hypothetical protein IJ538_00590 [Clostridia bacterium]|nr:hypothetical protein [Clostridia bacterium]
MLFKKKTKESKIAETPKEDVTEEKFSGKDIFFFVLTVLSVILYSSYTLFVIYNQASKNFLSNFIVYLLIAYVIIFLILIVISFGNLKKMKFRLKNFQSATYFLKYIIQIINFILSIVTAISAFMTTGQTNFSTIIFAILSLLMTIILIFIEIIKIKIRKNMPIIKQNFLDLHEKPRKNPPN